MLEIEVGGSFDNHDRWKNKIIVAARTTAAALATDSEIASGADLHRFCHLCVIRSLATMTNQKWFHAQLNEKDLASWRMDVRQLAHVRGEYILLPTTCWKPHR